MTYLSSHFLLTSRSRDSQLSNHDFGRVFSTSSPTVSQEHQPYKMFKLHRLGALGKGKVPHIDQASGPAWDQIK